MTWYPIAAVDDAVDATRGFLFPFSLVRWTKLALLVLLMAGGFRLSVSPPGVDWEAETFPEASLADLTAVDEAVAVAVVAAVALVAFLLWTVRLTLRLVFYDALRTDDVRLWTPFKRRVRQGVGLVVFFAGLALALVGPLAVAALVAVRFGVDADALGLGGWAILGLGVAGLLVAVALVGRFTAEFVVPAMVLRDDGVLAAWRRVWPVLRESWVQVLVYLVVHFFLALGIAVAEAVVFLLVGGTVVVLAAIVALVAAGVAGGFGALVGTTAGVAGLVLLALVALVALAVVLLPVRVLTTTYLVSYEVCTLGGFDADLWLLPESVVADPAVLDDGGNGE